MTGKQLLAVNYQAKVKLKQKISGSEILELILVFILLLAPRLYYLFGYIPEPAFLGWYTDTLHHWQIAYLSKEIGFHQGFLRLWDFKGMEFFWGLMHPLVQVILFTITGSISVLVPRMLSLVSGCLAYTFLFMLIKRYFNRMTAWAVIVWTIFFPITVFSNTIGEPEELGLLFIFGGLLLWPKKPIITGLLWAMASMVRAEYWLFCMGLIAGASLISKHKDKVILLAIGYGVLILAYMKYLVTYTGSYIFPIKLNFFASVRGDWLEDVPIVGVKLAAKRISQVIFSGGLLGGLMTLWKKPKQSLLWFFGFANLTFIGFMLGFGAYVRGFIPRIWYDRLYNWPYLFAAIVLITGLFYYLPRKWRWINKSKLNWLILLGAVIVSQRLWQPINFYVNQYAGIYSSEKDWAQEIANAYKGGKVLLPEDRPYITYYLAHDFGVEGKNMIGQMFDPFFYFKNKEKPFENWGEDRKVVLKWLKDSDIRLIVLTIPKETYLGLIEREPQYFKKLDSKIVQLYAVEFK